MINKFIGGYNIHQAIKRSIGQSWLPIYDYVKETCSNKDDVDKYCEKMMKDIAIIRETSQKPRQMLALKVSSFINHPFYLEKIRDVIYEAQWGRMDVLIDAEDNSMRTKENIVWDYLKSMKMTNGVYKTYQLYRKDALDELHNDLVDGKITSFKLVRGAYLHQDKSFVYSNKSLVDQSYDKGVKLVIQYGIKNRNDINLLVASHNEKSVGKALLTSMLNVDYKRRSQQIKFAQLLGMADKLTEDITNHGYDAYKYTPYGAYQESLPYLMRRLRENLDIMKYI